MHIFLLCVILGSILVQGGYFPTVILIAAILLSGAVIATKKRALTPCEIIAFFAAIFFFVSSLANGYNSASLAHAGLPGACAAFLYLYNSLPEQRKSRLIDGLIVGSGVFAGLAILAFCDVIDITGAVTSQRLQFTFQYANAAGTWFAAMALLAQDRENLRARSFLLPCLAALLLTRSVGALGTYAVIQLIRLWIHRKDRQLWQGVLLTHVLCAIFAGAFFFLRGWLALPVVVLLYLAGFYLQQILSAAYRIYLHWVCLGGGVLGIAGILLSRRVASALFTFVERISQIVDGGRLIVLHPIFGVGAGNWACLYPYYQSAQYTSTVVHSSIIQIGVDAGLPAIALAVLFVILALRQKGRPASSTLAAALLLVHSLMDFTLQFFPVCALFIALLFDAPSPVSTQKKSLTGPLVTTSALCFCVLTTGFLYTELQSKQLVRDVQGGLWNAILEKYEGQKFMYGNNQTAESCYIYALYYTGNFEGVIEAAQSFQMLDASELLLCAQSLRATGDQDAACELLLSELERQMYQVVLYEQISQLLRDWDADARYLEKYNRIVDLANTSQTILGRLQGNQVYINHIEGGTP